MRRMGGNKKTITATPRQLESLIRLSEALAKMRLSSRVERADVIEATRLMKVALQQAAIDPVTGTIGMRSIIFLLIFDFLRLFVDMDLITTGRSASSRTRMADLTKALRNLLDEQQVASITFDEIMALMRAQSDVDLPQSDLREALRELEAEEVIAKTNEGRNPTYLKLGGI